MKKLILIITLLLLTGCNSSGGAEKSLTFDPFSDQFNANAYNIGVFPLYPYRRDAGLLAIEQINNLGGVLGKSLNVVAVNFQTVDAFEVVDTEATAKRMMDDYNIQVITTGSSYVSLKLANLTVPRKALLLSNSATSPTLTYLEDNDFFFRMPPSDAVAGQVLAKLAWQNGAKTCVTLHVEQEAYGRELAAAFKDGFERLGGQVSNVIIPIDMTVGFGDYFTDIYGQQPDCFFPILLRSTTLANLVNESASAYFNGFYIFSDAALADGFENSIADKNQLLNSFAVTPGVGLQGEFEYEAFVQAYYQQFQKDPLNYTVHQYDLIMVLSLAIERAGLKNQTDNPTGEMVRDSLRAVINPPGTPVTPTTIAEGLALLRAGQDVDFQGASNTEAGWDENGDIIGLPVYNVYRFSEHEQHFVSENQITLRLPLEIDLISE